jgi:hypothetical protein
MVMRMIRASASIQLTILACFLIGLVAFGGAPRAFAITGSVLYTFGSATSENESQYTVYYTIPPVIQAGVPTNMTFFIYVTTLSGWKVQSQDQILQLTINTATESVTIPQTENSVVLYQGARWGPFNVTLDLNDSAFGLSQGQAVHASVFGDLVAYEQYDDPAYPFVVDSGATMLLTNVTLAAAPATSSTSGGHSTIPTTTTASTTNVSPFSGERALVSIGVGAVVVVALTGVALVTRGKGEKRKGVAQPEIGAEGPGAQS